MLALEKKGEEFHRIHFENMGEHRIENYQDLIVWQKSMKMVEIVYYLTNTLPPEEQWGLRSQMRRAAVSVPSNIAEGYGRQSGGNYKQFLAISRGSLFEIETQVLLCIRLNYFQEKQAEQLLSNITEIGKMLYSLISKLK
jgi:four helix bundle protein